MGNIKEITDILKHVKANDWKWILAFLATKNRVQIGKILQETGTYLIQGKYAMMAKMLGKISASTAAVAAGAYVVYGALKSGYEDLKGKLTDEQISTGEKIGAVLKETWMPYQFAKNWGKFFKWIANLNSVPGADPSLLPYMIKAARAHKGEDVTSQQLFEEAKSLRAKDVQQSSEQPKQIKQASPKQMEKLAKDAESHMVTKPSNPAAAHEWEKEQNRRVEIEMSKQNRNRKSDSTTKNAPGWYWKGKASKILASTLTWSTIKQYVSGAKFMTAAVMKVDLTIPTERVSATQCKIHHEIQSNIEILFQALRGKNTGAYTYTEEEVYWYVLNLASLIAKVRMLHKVIAISNTRSFEVKDIHKHLMVGLKGDRTTALTLLTDIINNKASYVAQINDLAKDLNTFAYLDSTLLSRWNYIADKAIQDYNGPKAVKGVYAIHYAPALDNSGNIIMEAFFTTNTTITTFSTYIGYVKTHLQRFMDKVASLSPTSGLAARISGDMIKLLGASGKTFGNVPYITGNEALTFEYDAEAVDQLRNAKMLPYTPQVAPYSGSAITAPTFNVGNGGTATSINLGEYGSNDRVITTDRNKEFVAAENIQMIQFQANVDVSAIASNQVKVYATEAGTTNLNRMTITSYSNNTTIEYYTISGLLDTDNALQYGGGSTDCQGFVSKTLPLLVQCDFCPRLQIVSASGTSITAPAVYCDLDNYAFMSERQYKDLNTVAVYSQYFYFNPEDVNIKGIIE